MSAATRSLLTIGAMASVAAVWLGGSASALTRPTEIRLLESGPAIDYPMSGFNFDRAPVGGDQFGFTHTLYRWAGTKQGARVGKLNATATFLTGFGPRFQQRPLVLFQVQVYLPAGTLMVEGYGRINPDGPSRFTFPVVGGTGLYANARGSVDVRDIGPSGERSAIRFRLTP